MATGLDLHPTTVGVRLPRRIMEALLEESRREGASLATLVRREAIRGFSTSQKVMETNTEVVSDNADGVKSEETGENTGPSTVPA